MTFLLSDRGVQYAIFLVLCLLFALIINYASRGGKR